MTAFRSRAWAVASWILAGVFGLALGQLTRPGTAIAQQAQADLIVDEPLLRSTLRLANANIHRNDCAVQEGCVTGTGRRKLLRFSTGTPNIGSADLYLGPPANDPDLYEFSSCHGHYHLDGYATYELLDEDGQTVVMGRKQAFCLMDVRRYSSDAGPAQYNCGNQGISAGWSDVYGSHLDCQWLDVTDVPAGNYFVRVTINPPRADGTRVLAEADYSNNVAVVPFTLTRRR